MLDRAKFSVGSFFAKKKIVDPTMDPTGIFFLYVIASPQAECQARVNVNATHGTKTRVAYVSLHLMGSSRSIYPAGITIGIPCIICGLEASFPGPIVIVLLRSTEEYYRHVLTVLSPQQYIS